MYLYETQLQEVPNTVEFSQQIAASTTVLNFTFTWATDIQEIIDDYDRALYARAQAEPLLRGQEIMRDYEWLTLYCDTIPHLSQTQVADWLASTGYIPSTLKDLPDDLIASNVYDRCREADGIRDYLEPLRDRLLWTVRIEDEEGDAVTGVVRSGGWLNEQSPNWRVKFVADRDIGRDDLLLALIDIEVAEDV